MEKSYSTYALPLSIALAVVLVVTGAMYYLSKSSLATGDQAPAGTYDVLAQCLTDNGAKFYGAFWCPHCQNQKKAFGDSAEFLPYIECSTPDGQAQTDECRSAGIMSYPTWEFADGARVTGEIKLSSLADLTGCPFPDVVE